jgi:hypothetical protein
MVLQEKQEHKEQQEHKETLEVKELQEDKVTLEVKEQQELKVLQEANMRNGLATKSGPKARGLPRTSTLEGQGRGKIKSRKGEKGEIRTGTTSAKGEQSGSCRKGGKGENSEGGTGANSRYRSNRSNRRLYRYRRRTNKRSNVQAKVFKSSLDRVTPRRIFTHQAKRWTRMGQERRKKEGFNRKALSMQGERRIL